MKQYFSCCGKYVCGGCIYSINKSENHDKCPFCNSSRSIKTTEENNEELMKRVEANDADAMCLMGGFYDHEEEGFRQDRVKAMELYARAADLGCGKAHSHLGYDYHQGQG